MPDISMCGNTKCPLKEKCYRFRAIPNPGRQSYMNRKFEDGKCDGFYKLQKDHVINPLIKKD